MESHACLSPGVRIARVVGCLMAAFLLLHATGCEKETVTGTDGIESSDKNVESVPTIYVDAAIGKDDFDGLGDICGTEGKGPKRSIQAGIDATPEGSICKVAPGVYTECVVMKDGITLAGSGANRTFINGGNIKGENIITIWGCEKQTTVYGFTITNGSCYGDNAGIRIQYSDNVTIRNNVITRNRADGIRIYWASPAIANNTIALNGRNGIMVCYDGEPRVVNNIIANNCLYWPGSDNGGWGLYASWSAVIGSSYNDVWKHNFDYGMSDGGISEAGTGDISTDPMFVDPYGRDFRLAAGSPCIDAGTDVGLKYSGAAPDLGAFEYRK